MTIKNKEQKLKDFALSCFNDISHKKNLQDLLLNLQLEQDDIISEYVRYDLDIFSYSNEIYSSPEMRMVMHIHNLLEGSWHIERQNIIYKFMSVLKPSSIMDIGFGIPSLYIKKFLEHDNTHITLSDFSMSALSFASALLYTWEPDWNNKVNLILEDMMITSMSPPKNDIYLFQDSIEHVEDPTTCLTNFVKNSHSEAKFLLSLPIGPIVPMHHIAWHSELEASKWLNDCGLEIELKEKIDVNPEVDLFAEQLNFHCTNLVVLCHKTQDMMNLNEI